MLSEENRNKIIMTGLYICEPQLNWLPEYKRDNPYWCKNWTFKPIEYGGKLFMRDTYWSTETFQVELTDDNFSLFSLIFDFNNVEDYRGSIDKWCCYNEKDRWCVAVNSGGRNHPKYYIRKESKPNKDFIVKRLEDEIKIMKYDLEYKLRTLEEVKNDQVDLRYM